MRPLIPMSSWDSPLSLIAYFLFSAPRYFWQNPDDIGRFAQLYDALQDHSMVGAIASATLATLFAVALLASGQNATITGTLTGQIVM